MYIILQHCTDYGKTFIFTVTYESSEARMFETREDAEAYIAALPSQGGHKLRVVQWDDKTEGGK